MIDENTWSMILGKTGSLPGEVGEEIVELAKKQDRTFYEGDAQSLYPDVLDEYRKKMREKGWDMGKDDEELFEYAMHPGQYEELKSGEAKKRFELELRKRKEKTGPHPERGGSQAPAELPTSMIVDVDGEQYKVTVSYNGQVAPAEEKDNTTRSTNAQKNGTSAHATITAPLEGKFFLTRENGERPLSVGDVVHKGDTVAYIESMKVINAITADKEGKVAEIVPNHGATVDEDDVIIRLTGI